MSFVSGIVIGYVVGQIFTFFIVYLGYIVGEKEMTNTKAKEEIKVTFDSVKEFKEYLDDVRRQTAKEIREWIYFNFRCSHHPAQNCNCNKLFEEFDKRWLE